MGWDGMGDQGGAGYSLVQKSWMVRIMGSSELGFVDWVVWGGGGEGLGLGGMHGSMLVVRCVWG